SLRIGLKPDLYFLRLAVSCGVADRFLADAIELHADRFVNIHGGGLAVKRAGDAVDGGDRVTKLLERRDQALLAQHEGLQSARQIARPLVGALKHRHQLSRVGGVVRGALARLPGQALLECSPDAGDAGELLAQVIMKILSEAASFPLARFEHLTLHPPTLA